MELRNIHSFGTVFDLKISRQANGKIVVSVVKGNKLHTYTLTNGETAHVEL
jgi:hypothetical protein